MNKKGQGTIEYLVILAIIVVIALVVVTILSQFTGQGTAIRKQSADSAWKSAQPISVTETKKTADGNVTLRIKNSSANAITLTAFDLSTTDVNAHALPALSAGQEVTISIGTGATCTAGSAYTYPKAGITVTYDTATISGNNQSIPDDLIIMCS